MERKEKFLLTVKSKATPDEFSMKSVISLILTILVLSDRCLLSPSSGSVGGAGYGSYQF